MTGASEAAKTTPEVPMVALTSPGRDNAHAGCARSLITGSCNHGRAGLEARAGGRAPP